MRPAPASTMLHASILSIGSPVTVRTAGPDPRVTYLWIHATVRRVVALASVSTRETVMRRVAAGLAGLESRVAMTSTNVSTTPVSTRFVFRTTCRLLFINKKCPW